ncbi:MAG: amino acid ABC transporter permease [Ruminococcaceae bacterium]|nr:amino acid ABC transporter permease [Oscillospiraceae bacterium]
MPQLLIGLKVTLQLFCLTLVFSIPLGLVVSLGRISPFKPLQWLVQLYLLIFRGTPLMLQLFFFYFGLPFIDFNPFTPELNNLVLDRFDTAVLAFVMNYAAYFAEIFRGGIIGVNQGQYEAAKALGLNSGQTMWHIVIPQMLHTVVPPVANETIVLVKDTALVSSIALIDMLKKAQQAVNRDMNVTAYLLVAIIYLVITMVLTYFFNYLERRMSLSQRRS